MAADRWIAANIAGVGDCMFRTDALSDGAAPPPVFLAKKLTILLHGVDKAGKHGVVPKKVGDRNVNGAHLILWAECTANDRSVMATVWPDEIAVVERKPFSLVGKEDGHGS